MRPQRRAPARWSALLALALCGPAPVAAQVALQGRVLRVTEADTQVVSRAMVVLHRIHADAEGPIDSLLSGPGGRWQVMVRPDSGALYLLSARWGGVTYFGGSFTAASLIASQALDLFVSDTSSGVPVMLATRQVVVMRGEEGTREVVDAMTLINSGSATRVLAPERPWTWRFLLPPGATDPHLGDSDFAAEALSTVGDTVMVLAPIPPGQHVLMMSYRLAASQDSLPLPLLEAPDTLLVMLEEPEARVAGLVRGETRPVEDRLFTEWQGRPDRQGVVVHFPVPWRTPSWFLPAIVACFGVLLAALALVGRRRRIPVTAVPSEAPVLHPEAAALVDAMVALDRALAEGTVTPEAHRTRRVELKEALQAQLKEKAPTAARPEPPPSS